jgi:hypothetical protein
MKRSVLIIALASLALLTGLAGCSSWGVFTATGPVVTRNYNITGFTGVEAGSVFDIELKFHKVEVMTHSSLFEVTDQGAVVIHKDSSKEILAADTVIMRWGWNPSKEFTVSSRGI